MYDFFDNLKNKERHWKEMVEQRRGGGGDGLEDVAKSFLYIFNYFCQQVSPVGYKDNMTIIYNVYIEKIGFLVSG